MFRSDGQTNYDYVYESVRRRLPGVDHKYAAQCLGAIRDRHGLAINMFKRTCLVDQSGIQTIDGAPLPITYRLCLAYYLLQAGRGELTRKWVAYRDFKDGAFFHAAYAQLVEDRIAKGFATRLPDLFHAAGLIGGEPLAAGLGGDLCFSFPALPRIPLALVFYDADEDFPASARVLYDASAPEFLDMECLAVLGLILAEELCATII